MNKQIDFQSAEVQRELLQLLPDNIRESAAVLIGGSLVGGYGNATSDIDIVAFVSEEKTGLHHVDSGRSVRIAEGFDVHVNQYGGRRTDLEIVSTTVITQLAAALRENPDDASVVSDPLRVTLNNLRTGIPIRDEVAVTSLRDSFPWRLYARALALEGAQRYQGPAEDAAGGIESLDVGPAIFSSRMALDNSVFAFLASRHVTNLRSKWRIRMLREFGSPGDADKFLSAHLEQSLIPEEVVLRAKARLALAQQFLSRAHLELQRLVVVPTTVRDQNIKLSGYPNARTLAGTSTSHGPVRERALFRAGNAGHVIESELVELGIGTIIDLTSPSEESTSPSHGSGIECVEIPVVEMNATELVQIANALLNATGAVLIHCAKGRDRTGWAIASLLRALGAPISELTVDYMEGVRGWDDQMSLVRSEAEYAEVEEEFRQAVVSFDSGELLSQALGTPQFQLLRQKLVMTETV